MRDGRGYQRNSGGDDFLVPIYNDSLLSGGRIVDLKDGTYEVMARVPPNGRSFSPNFFENGNRLVNQKKTRKFRNIALSFSSSSSAKANFQHLLHLP